MERNDIASCKVTDYPITTLIIITNMIIHVLTQKNNWDEIFKKK